jgi:hypothetical protein
LHKVKIRWGNFAGKSIPKLRMSILYCILQVAKRIEEKDGRVIPSRLIKESGVSSRTVYRYLRLFERMGWARRVRAGEFRPIVFFWDKIPPAYYLDGPIDSSENLELVKLVREALVEIKLMSMIYGTKRLIRTRFSNMTFRKFVKRYWTTIIKILHKIAFRQPLSEDELPIAEALISFAQSFRDLGIIIKPKF